MGAKNWRSTGSGENNETGGSRPALVTEIKNAHGVQITTRRFVGHEKLFAYRELGRRAIVALSGIQAPKWAYGKTNGEGNTIWKSKTVA